MLYREQTFAPRAFHSELQQQTNIVNTQKSPPWACDKGCAEACAERFSALKSETVCDLRTWDEGLGDIKYGTRERLGWRRRTSNTGTHGTRMWMIIAKVGGKSDVSHFSREYVLVKAAHCSTLIYSYGSVTREFLHVCLGKNHLHWRKWNRCSGLTADGILEP